MFKASRRLLGLLCAALAVVAAGAASAQAHVFQVNGERTALMPSAASGQFLAANDITVTTTGNASIGADGSLILPITHGSVNADTMDGHIFHSGGVTFSRAGRSFNYRDFILVRDGGRTFLSALVNDRGRETYGTVTQFAVTPATDNEVFVTGEVKLSRSTAHAFNTLVGSDVVAPGIDIGKLQSLIRIVP
jgi:hypothetical protein